MFFNDSKSGHLGILPGRASGFAASRGLDLAHRESVLMADVIRRDQWPAGFNQFVFDDESVGDLNGARLWKVDRNAPQPRSIPMWRFATPCQIEAPEDPVPQCGNIQNQFNYRPIFRIDPDSGFMIPDDRVNPDQVVIPSCNDQINIKVWNSQPAGTFGIDLAVNDEDDQGEIFLPTDPRLITATNGDPFFSTQVCDIADDGASIAHFCHARDDGQGWRAAPMNTFARVVAPDNTGAYLNPVCPAFGPTVAWQVGFDPCFGIVTGIMAFGGVGRTMTGGVVSHQFHGVFHPGDPADDKHRLFDDFDNNKINSLHIWTEAKYFQSKRRDAPLDFSFVDYEPARRGDVPYQVELRYDPAQRHDFCGPESKEGLWRWETWITEDTTSSPESPFDPGPPIDPPYDPDDLPGDIYLEPNLPPWYLVDGAYAIAAELSNEETQQHAEGQGAGACECGEAPACNEQDAARRHFLISHNEKAFPALLARPQYIKEDAADLRNWITGKSLEVMAHSKRTAPVVARLEAFGVQQEPRFKYCVEPGTLSGRYPVGSASGAWGLFSPDLAVEDFVFNRYDATKTYAEANLVIAPDFSYLKFGTPDPTNDDTTSDGVSVHYDSTTDELTVRHKSSGTYNDNLQSTSTGVKLNRKIMAPTSGALTISGGAITVTGSHHSLQ